MGIFPELISHIDFDGPLPERFEFGRCWLWTGKMHCKKYGVFYLKKSRMKELREKIDPHGRSLYARLERYAGTRKPVYLWMLILNKGKHPRKGECAHHRCHNHSCINPRHLAIVTKREDVLERHRAGRSRGPSHIVTASLVERGYREFLEGRTTQNDEELRVSAPVTEY
jgi:hypothetical protein